jgi:hypothetical protein
MSPGRKTSSRESQEHKVSVRCIISGEPAKIFLELKRRGIVRSTRDAVVQGLMSLHERIVQRDLKIAQLKASQRLNEET